MIDQFCVAFDEALQGVEAYSARRRGKNAATSDAGVVELWSPGKEAPRVFALCEGIPPVTIALGVSFDDCAKVICSRRDEGITFSSAENARQSLSTHGNVQLVWPDELALSKAA
jgi:hypothetical protein